MKEFCEKLTGRFYSKTIQQLFYPRVIFAAQENYNSVIRDEEGKDS